MDSRELKIILSLKDELSVKLGEIQDQLNKTEKTANKSEKSFKDLAKAVVATGIAFKSYQFLKSAVESFAEAESAQIRLAILTKNSTNATNEQIEALYNQAKELERVGVVSGSNISFLQGQLATFDLTTASIEKLTPALLNMAVSERGVAVTSADMISFAEGVSKAIQGNYSALERRGFILDDDTKKMIENGTETERVNAITEVLNTTYKDMNQLMTQTTAGSLANMRNRLGAMKEEIGRAVIPSLNTLLTSFVDVKGGIDESSVSFERFGETAYRVTNLFVAIGQSIKLGTQTITAFVDTTITEIAKGKEEAELLAKGYEEILTETANKVSQAWEGFTKAKNFEMPKLDPSIIRGGGSGGAGFDDLNTAMKETVELTKVLTDEFSKMGNKIGDTLFDLEADHKSALESIRKDIDQTTKSIQDLNNQYNRQKVSDERSIASEVVAVQSEVADIQEQLAGRLSRKERAILEEQLAEKKKILEDNAEFISSINTSIEEEQRRASLSDLARAIEDYQQKRMLADEEFSTKMSRLNEELQASRKKEQEEIALFEQKKKFIIDATVEIAEIYKQYAEKNKEVTKENVEKEIEYYNRLADAIARARGASNVSALNYAQGKVNSVNDAIIAPGGNIISTHPDDYLIATKNPNKLGGGSVVVNVYGDVSGEELVDKVQSKLMDSLRENTKLNI